MKQTKRVYLSVQTNDESIVNRWRGNKQQAYAIVEAMLSESDSATVYLQYNKTDDGFFKETVATCEIYREEHNGLLLWTVAIPYDHVSVEVYPTWKRNRYSFMGRASAVDRLCDFLVSAYADVREELDKVEEESKECPY